ncbi:SirB2 family protein [Actinomadura sp. ATCC 31491]|uniref:SirB2 family protein n=1 Tax=Actinomadura luzonensis TaxID=2805427 RepID=A0ABT0FNL7_9ACTN|nr:SirB2 family protein [Actinomadura luzonensis]MCK2213902.1 SirB2 family protein [Actinomadura luzonensis]
MLRPRIRKTVLVIHIAVSVALAGEVWGLVALNTAAALTKDGELAHAAYRLMPVLVFAGGIPLSLTALISGITLGLGGHWGLFRYYWVTAKLVLLVAVICTGMFLFDPAGMAEATAGGGAAGAGRQWGQVAVPGTQLAMLLAATALSVFKPRGSRRGDAPRPGGTVKNLADPQEKHK